MQMVTLRQGKPGDEPRIEALLAACGMAAEVDPHDCRLAETNGRVVGLVRLEWGDAVPYIRPIAIAPGCRGQGLGRRLIESLLGEVDELCAVARGESVGFYRQLHFEPIPWESVYAPFRDECDTCEDRAICSPVPMRLATPNMARVITCSE